MEKSNFQKFRIAQYVSAQSSKMTGKRKIELSKEAVRTAQAEACPAESQRVSDQNRSDEIASLPV